MKKLLAFCLMFAMFCMAFIGCGQGTTYFSMFDIIGANRTSALLDHYDSIHVIYHWEGVVSGYNIDSRSDITMIRIYKRFIWTMCILAW